MTISQLGTQLTPAQAAEQAAVGAALPASPTAAAASSSTGTTASALSTLGSNFNDFLNLLTTQLQNQDPTAPMDANQFTSELVQFTGVQQEVSTNTSLAQLISLTQQSQVLTASQYIGHQATVTSTALSLQNGSGEITYQGQAGQDVGIAVVDGVGTTIRTATATAQDGTNTWTWDGLDNSGNVVPDGAYRVAVDASTAGAAPVAVPFEVIGTATGVSNTGTAGLMLQLGALSVGLGSVQSVSAN